MSQSSFGRFGRLVLVLVLVLSALLVGVESPASGVTIVWEQGDDVLGDDPYDVAAFRGGLLYASGFDIYDGEAVLHQEFVVLDPITGVPTYSLPMVSGWQVDAVRDRILVYRQEEFAPQEYFVFDGRGDLIVAAQWGEGPPYLGSFAISGSLAAVVVSEPRSGTSPLRGEDRVELYDLDTLTPVSVLARAPDLSRYGPLGSGGDSLLVASSNYYVDESGFARYLNTSVLVYEDLILVREVTLNDPQGRLERPTGVAPAANGDIYVMYGNLNPDGEQWLTAVTRYDSNGDVVDRIWMAPNSGESVTARGVGIDVDACFGLIGMAVSGAWDDQPLKHYGFKHVADDQNRSCFLDTLDSQFNEAVVWLGTEGVTRGCNPPLNDKFCPDSFVTRGQMAALLVRALGLTDQLDNPFTDDDESIFETDIEKLAAAGITKGCNPPANDMFCPESKVTREQMAAFLVRAMGYTDPGSGDLFIDDNDSIFEGDIDKLGSAGVTKGCNPPTNDMFCPTEYVTRGQMAALLHRALG